MKNKKSVGFFKGFWVHITKDSDVLAMCREMAATGASRMWALIDDKSWVVIQFYVFNSLFANSGNFVIPLK